MVLRQRNDGDQALEEIFREWTGYGWYTFWEHFSNEHSPSSCSASGEACSINYEWIRWSDGNEKILLTGQLAKLDWDAFEFDECEEALPTLPWSLRDAEEMQSGR